MILGWTVLRPSVRERWLRLAALVIALAITCALTLVALLADPRHPGRLWAAVVGCAALAAFIAWRLPRGDRPLLEVAVDAHGAPLLRATPRVAEGGAMDGAPVAGCVFAAPWLITLRRGALRAPIWPDSMPADAFRRLYACVRWGSPAPDTGRPSAPDPS